MIGAAAGLVAGSIAGAVIGRKKTRARLMPYTGWFIAGGLLAGAAVAWACMKLSRDFSELVFVVPSVVCVFTGAGAMLMVLPRHLAVRKLSADGLYCPRCGYDLRESKQFGRCPECGRPMDEQCVMRERDAGWGIAWRMAAHGLFWSIVGMVVGWALLIVVFK
jgi:hypothetical protein